MELAHRVWLQWGIGQTVWQTLATALVVASMVVIVVGKDRIHGFVHRHLSQGEVRHALLLALATLVVLPLMPDRYLGPFTSFNPRATWTIVVLILAVGALGHLAQRLLGAQAGLTVAGLISGFVSSIATIAAMGQLSRRTPELMRPAVAGAVLSSVATVAQIMFLVGVTSPQTLRVLLLPLLCAGAVAVLYAGFFATRALTTGTDPGAPQGEIFSLRVAMLLALAVSVITVLAAAVDAWFGVRGLMAVAAVTGFADAHASAVSVASLVASNTLPATQAVVPVLCALTTNTLTKAVIALTAGGPRFALSIVPGLMLMVGAAWATLAVGQ